MLLKVSMRSNLNGLGSLMLLGLLLLTYAASAADQLSTRRAYLAIKDNGDLFVGESSAWVKDEGNDAAQAEAVAAVRAKASLAEAIEVRVQSQIEDTQVSSPAGSSQTVKATSKASSDLKLENVKTQAFADLPKAGQVTVLAYISKEDYRRQRAGKSVAVYRPENGLRAFGALYAPGFWTDLATDGRSEMTTFGLDLVWRHFVIGVSHSALKSGALAWRGTLSNVGNSNGLLLDTAHLGYEWTPFAWRVQPYLPVGVEYGNLWMGVGTKEYTSNLMAGTAGLGLRYWANDSLALEFAAVGRIPFGSFEPVLKAADTGLAADFSPKISLSGMEYRVQFLWSAF